ncbi:hypothetical protein [Undibacterium oligocarboniphilum]|uniref:Uncharacterized protein n=1 Tax=Undibacterium oligocarboniphilum TaxID=666702 RepID=A0A850QJF6_9BURK|nr:hypothetical protein [Undibacterium oligocarboniphilum]MBC3871752.1 hypothetical protein [Undibacterium oligocarboniphilum]NVO79388.1 hypothetical protein [Undibacterium oligocarboniphilum]
MMTYQSQNEATAFITQGSMYAVAEVFMPDVVGDYDDANTIPEWTWIEQNASYQHCSNGEDGVFEFILNLSNAFDAIPERLQPVFEQAKAKNLSYLIFHQGT